MAEVVTRQFVPASQAAVKDAQLRQALRRAGTGFDGTRREAIAEVTPETWEEWRQQARRVKEHTIGHLDYYLEMLERNVTAAGGQVHFAVDAQQANAIVSQIARANDVRTVTKSKSMVSEELGLNHVLEAQGVEVFETDLGEYIIQLADETPSHLVAPALHKTRGQVAQLFADQLGVPYSDDIEEMARIARVVFAPEVPGRRHGHQRGQLPGGGNRLAGDHHQRGERPVVHLRAAGSRWPGRHGESDPIVAGPGGVLAAAASLGHGAAHHVVHEHGDRAAPF